jgi:hypothetical protein
LEDCPILCLDVASIPDEGSNIQTSGKYAKFELLTAVVGLSSRI